MKSKNNKLKTIKRQKNNIQLRLAHQTYELVMDSNEIIMFFFSKLYFFYLSDNKIKRSHNHTPT